MNKDNQNIPMIYNEASIILPIDEDAFKEFMVSLLGQPESIEGYTEGAFEIDTGDFNYLNQLIDERITTQNLSSLLEFRAKLFFNDNTSMTFNGVQSFLDFHDLRPVICKGFIFTWSYLVKFNNKKSSEKQEISISSVEEEPSSIKKSKKKSSLFGFGIQVDKVPKITYSVRCTDRSWGIEIMELIRKCLFNIVKSNSSPWIDLRKKIIENFEVVEFLLFILSITIFFFFFCYNFSFNE